MLKSIHTNFLVKMQSVLNRRKEGKMENRNGKLIMSTKGAKSIVGIVAGVVLCLFGLVASFLVLDKPRQIGYEITHSYKDAESVGTIIGIALIVLSLFALLSVLLGARSHANLYENCVEGTAVKGNGLIGYFNVEKFSVPYSKISAVSEEGFGGNKSIVIRTKDGLSYKVIAAKNRKEAVEAIRSRINDN